MMIGMSFSETIFLFFLALVIFGPKKLPEIARQVGKALNEFKRASNEFKAQIEQEISNLEVEKNRHTILPASLPPENVTSRALKPGSEQAVPSESPATLATTSDEAVQSGSSEVPPVATEADAPVAPPDSASISSSHADAANNDLTSPASQESHV
jgi:sec-independent protein translocase protein TatB